MRRLAGQGIVRIKSALGNAGAVAQVDEDQSS
jgi:hypothetical protein